MLEPYEEDPEAAEEDALEDELARKLNLLITDLVGDIVGQATLTWYHRSGDPTLRRTSCRP